jgi:hypothetical protein
VFNSSGGTNPLDRQGGAPAGVIGQGGGAQQRAPQMGGMGGGGMGGGGMPNIPPNL